MAGTQLYTDKGNPFNPITSSDAVKHGTGNIKDELDKINAKLSDLDKMQSGADLIEGDFNVEISYLRTVDNKVPSTSSGWGSNMTLPDASLPYLWKKTKYLWKDVEVTTKVEIVTTSLYPQVRYMYCAINDSTTTVTGPSNDTYSDGISDKDPRSSAKWYTTPQSVTPSAPSAYMCMQQRNPGESWSSFSPAAKYGSYAFDSIPVNRYYIGNSTTCDKNPNSECNNSTGELSETNWKKSINALNLSEGNTYYVFQTLSVLVLGILVKVNDSYFWSDPSLISIIKL